jgi:glycosyltransferase involved in cell wall biosynthesis
LVARARIAICVATYQRPVLLRSLLLSLRAQVFPHNSDVDVVLVVVDNDVGAGSRSVVDELREEIPFPIEYAVEPRRGIPHARNCAVMRALDAGADFVAFIDDDEVASINWLDELVSVQRGMQADVVSGPSLPRYADGVPKWVAAGSFFHYPRYRTGTRIHIAATNNVLIARRLLADHPEPFDPAFGLSGMDDSHFFMRVRNEGARLFWADEALVEEFIPASKARVAWILQRAYRIGNGYVFCVRDLHPAYRWLLPRVMGALARILFGALLLPLGVLRGRTAMVSALRTIANGVGSIVGMVGVRFEEYTVVHGK